MNRTTLGTLAGLMATLASSFAGAAWTNQMGNGDSNTTFLGAGAASATTACAVGFVNTGSNPQSLYALTTTGDSWSEGGFTGYGASVAFADESTGYIGGLIGKVWRTDNGGASWTELPDATVGGGTLMNAESVVDILISSDGETVIIVGGSGLLARSTDGGSTWEKLEVSLPEADGTLSAGAMVGDNVWLAGGVPREDASEGSDTEDATEGYPASAGFVLFSDDGGVTFSTATSGLSYYVSDVSFVNPAEGWAAGATYAEGGAAVGKTSDGGETWDFASVPDFPEGEVFGINLGASVTPAGCSRVSFFGREVGLALCTAATYETDGAAGIFLTDDGGETWTVQEGYKDSFASPMLSATAMTDMAAPDCHRAWIVGSGKLIVRWDNDDAGMDCEAGGGPSEEVPDDVANPDDADGSGGGDGCGCSMKTPRNGGLFAVLLSLLP